MCSVYVPALYKTFSVVPGKENKRIKLDELENFIPSPLIFMIFSILLLSGTYDHNIILLYYNIYQYSLFQHTTCMTTPKYHWMICMPHLALRLPPLPQWASYVMILPCDSSVGLDLAMDKVKSSTVCREQKQLTCNHTVPGWAHGRIHLRLQTCPVGTGSVRQHTRQPFVYHESLKTVAALSQKGARWKPLQSH